MGADSYDYLVREAEGSIPSDDGGAIDWRDSKIAFVIRHARNRRVLDLGCVQHNPLFARSKGWLHKAVKEVALEVVGLDLDAKGVRRLHELGYGDIVVGDAQSFDLGRTFEVIVAGDLIEHLHDVGGFLESCRRHMSREAKLLICTPNPWHWHRCVKALRRDPPVNPEHTLWMCPVTLRQVALRFGLRVESVTYASQRRSERVVPLPRRLRHESFYAVLRATEPSGVDGHD